MKKLAIFIISLVSFLSVGGCAVSPPKRPSLLDKPEKIYPRTGPSQKVIGKYMVCDEEPAPPPAPKEEIKPQKEIGERINKRSEALNECQKAGENNAGMRLEQGKDHSRLYLLLADEIRATEIDRAFINFLQSVRNLPTREGYLFLAYAQKEKGWIGKAKASLKKAGYPEWTWKQLDEWVKTELSKEPKLKSEKMTLPPKPAVLKKEEKPPSKKKPVCIKKKPVKSKEPTFDELEKAWQEHLRKSRDCKR